MNSRLLSSVILIAMVMVPSVIDAQTTVTKARLKSLDQYIEKSVKEWNIPGLAIGIIKDDSVVFAKGYGTRTAGKNEPVDIHTMFAIASLSKAFTTACLGRLVDLGALHWDDKVTDHLPYFQMFDPYVTREMTVRDLLCHRSGSKTFGGDLVWYGTHYSRREVVERLRHLKPTYSFRSHYGYQNLLYVSAGEIFPALTGRTWDEFVRDSIFLPLGMTETNTSVRDLEGRANVATPHALAGDSLVLVPYRNVDNIGADAAVNSNVSDMLKWIRMWLLPDSVRKPVSNATRHQVWSPHTIIDISERERRAVPDVHFRAAALGWFTMDYRGRKVLNHGGGMDGMISRISLVPEENLGVIILTNSINSLPGALEYRILDLFLGGSERDWSAQYLKTTRSIEARRQDEFRKADSLRNRSSQPSLPLEKYAGLYGGPLYGDVRVEFIAGRLAVQFVPTASFRGTLTHWQYDTFAIELEDKSLPTGLVTFCLDADGVAAEMKIDIPNPDFDFTELELRRK